MVTYNLAVTALLVSAVLWANANAQVYRKNSRGYASSLTPPPYPAIPRSRRALSNPWHGLSGRSLVDQAFDKGDARVADLLLSVAVVMVVIGGYILPGTKLFEFYHFLPYYSIHPIPPTASWPILRSCGLIVETYLSTQLLMCRCGVGVNAFLEKYHGLSAGAKTAKTRHAISGWP